MGKQRADKRLVSAGAESKGPPVAGRHVEKKKGVERDCESASLQILDRPHDPGVGRRAAIGGRLVDPADEPGLAAPEPRAFPGHRLVALCGLHARLHPRMSGPQVVGEPGRHQSRPLQARAQRRQLVERSGPIAFGVKHVPVEKAVLSRAEALAHHVRVETVFARARNDAHGAQVALQCSNRAEHLGRNLRDAVSPALQGQAVEHEIGQAPIGRRVAPPLLGLDQRIGFLRLRAEMDAKRRARPIHLLAVRPDPPHPGDRSLAKGHREVAEVPVARSLAGAGSPTALGALALRGRRFLEARCPNDLAGDPRRAEQPSDPATLVRIRNTALRPRPSPPAACLEQACVERRATERAERATCNGAERAAHQTAQRSARRLQDDCRHDQTFRGNRKRPPTRLHQPGVSAEDTTAAPSYA